MTIEQAVKLIVNSVRKNGTPKQSVVEKLWKSSLRDSLSSHEKEALAKEGLLERVRSILTNGAYLGPAPQVVKINVQPLSIEARQINILIGTCFTMENGEERSLMDFHVEHFQYCISQNEAQIAGLSRRNMVFDYGIRLLQSQRVNSVQELSGEAQKSLASEWSTVVNRKEEITEEVVA